VRELIARLDEIQPDGCDVAEGRQTRPVVGVVLHHVELQRHPSGHRGCGRPPLDGQRHARSVTSGHRDDRGFGDPRQGGAERPLGLEDLGQLLQRAPGPLDLHHAKETYQRALPGDDTKVLRGGQLVRG
jgi:hypothetical protein